MRNSAKSRLQMPYATVTPKANEAKMAEIISSIIGDAYPPGGDFPSDGRLLKSAESVSLPERHSQQGFCRLLECIRPLVNYIISQRSIAEADSRLPERSGSLQRRRPAGTPACPFRP